MTFRLGNISDVNWCDDGSNDGSDTTAAATAEPSHTASCKLVRDAVAAVQAAAAATNNLCMGPK